MILEDLKTYLREHRLVVAQVSARVYPGNAPASADTPYITFRRTGGNPEHHLDGVSDLVSGRFEFSVWAEYPEQAGDAADALVKALDGFRGEMDDTSIRGVFLQDESENFLAAQNASEVGIFEERRVFEIRYLRTAPTTADQPLRRA